MDILAFMFLGNTVSTARNRIVLTQSSSSLELLMLCHYNHQVDGTLVVFCHSTLMDTLFQLEKGMRLNPHQQDYVTGILRSI
jgi:hypothetical protein